MPEPSRPSAFDILLVEDERVLLESMADLLREHGWTVDTASSGMQAVRKLRRNNYRLVITDASLGDSGFDLPGTNLLQWIRTGAVVRLPAIMAMPAILWSSYDFEMAEFAPTQSVAPVWKRTCKLRKDASDEEVVDLVHDLLNASPHRR